MFCFRMYGLFQTAFYFGYMALFSSALGIMCGKLHFILILMAVCAHVNFELCVMAVCAHVNFELCVTVLFDTLR